MNNQLSWDGQPFPQSLLAESVLAGKEARIGPYQLRVISELKKFRGKRERDFIVVETFPSAVSLQAKVNPPG